MSVKTLKSFLIGIGYDTKGLDAGDKKIQSSLQGIKSSALGIGAAIGALGAGAGVIASTANKIDRLAAATQNMRTPMRAVYDFGNAVELMGGQAGEALDALKRFEEFQNNFNLNGQDGSIDSLAKAGIDVSALAATRGGDAMDFLRELERQYQGLNEGQRAQVQSALGFSNGVSRLLGEGKTESRMAQAADNTGSIDQMTESARRFAESNENLSQKFEGMANELADKFLPRLIGASEWMGRFLDEHREEISKTIEYASQNPASAALGASAATVTLGSVLSYLGLGGVGKAVTRAGAPGLIASGSYMATDSIFDKLEEHEGYRRFSDSVDNGARNIGLGWAVDFSDWAFNKDRSQESTITNDGARPPEPVTVRLDAAYGERSAADSMPPKASPDESFKEVQPQNNDDLVRAIQRAKLNVNNNLTIKLDGRELDARIIQVNERQNYEAAEDLKSTTER